MNLEQQYIEKLNFDLGSFSKDITISFKKNLFLHFMIIKYQSPTKKMDSITLELYNPKKINLVSKIRSLTSDYSEIFNILIKMTEQFREHLTNEPLFFVEYLKDLHIQNFKQLKQHSFINYDPEKLYEILSKQNFTLENFPKDMLPKKSFDINLFYINFFLDSVNISNKQFKVTYKSGNYNFTFSTQDSISLSFNDAAKFLYYFSFNENINKIFNLEKNNGLFSLLQRDQDLNIKNNRIIEQNLLNLELENF